ncbi:MAG: hypothetical protein AAF226_08665 [Verrucomicrobiota bacterium]
MAALDDFGIVSISTALTKKFSLRHQLEESEVVLTEAGEFHHACTHDCHYTFDADGAGDFPVDFGIATAGPTIAGLAGGVTIVDQTGERQKSGEPNEWSASGEHAPMAS